MYKFHPEESAFHTFLSIFLFLIWSLAVTGIIIVSSPIIISSWKFRSKFPIQSNNHFTMWLFTSALIQADGGEDVQADLERACVEVAQEYPLGAYAVDYIQYHVSPILSYHEAEVQITYRRTKEQMDAIVSATGISGKFGHKLP